LSSCAPSSNPALMIPTWSVSSSKGTATPQYQAPLSWRLLSDPP
jgi:hypothetical protein